MPPEFQLILLAIIGYLIGSISAAIITCRLMGLEDPRSSGSNNPGATNVLRIGGKKAAIITLFGDMLKGLFPVALVQHYGFSDSVIAAVAIAAFLGHLFPIFFRFQGGKGVATYFGTLIGIDWQGGIIALAIWLSVAYITRYSSLAAILTSLSAPLVIWKLTESSILLVACSFMSALLLVRHRGNIQRLYRGEEDKIGKKRQLH